MSPLPSSLAGMSAKNGRSSRTDGTSAWDDLPLSGGSARPSGRPTQDGEENDGFGEKVPRGPRNEEQRDESGDKADGEEEGEGTRAAESDLVRDIEDEEEAERATRRVERRQTKEEEREKEGEEGWKGRSGQQERREGVHGRGEGRGGVRESDQGFAASSDVEGGVGGEGGRSDEGDGDEEAIRHQEEEACWELPVYRKLPILTGILAPFSILLEVPGLTEHWYVHTENGHPVQYRPNPPLLDVALALSIVSAVLANTCIILRFLERRTFVGTKGHTLAAVLFFFAHDSINAAALITFGIIHATNDGFTYSEAYWMTLASTAASLAATVTLLIDYVTTKDFDRAGSGLTRKQRELVIVVMLLLADLALGSLCYEYLIGLNFQDALYFTICTVTTVGFGDYSPKTVGARIFTFFYASASIILIGLTINTARQTLLEAFEDSYRRRRALFEQRYKERQREKEETRHQRANFPRRVSTHLDHRMRHHRSSIVRGGARAAKAAALPAVLAAEAVAKTVSGVASGMKSAMEGLSTASKGDAEGEEEAQTSEKGAEGEDQMREKGTDLDLTEGCHCEEEGDSSRATGPSVPMNIVDGEVPSLRSGGSPSLSYPASIPDGARREETRGRSGMPDRGGVVTDFDEKKGSPKSSGDVTSLDRSSRECRQEAQRGGDMEGEGTSEAAAGAESVGQGDEAFSGLTATVRIQEDLVLQRRNLERSWKACKKRLKNEETNETVAKIAVAWTFFFAFWLTGALAFHFTEGWTYFEALWFCFVFFSSIDECLFLFNGFEVIMQLGCLSPKKGPSRAFFIVWSLFGISVLAILFSVIQDTWQDTYKRALSKASLSRVMKCRKARCSNSHGDFNDNGKGRSAEPSRDAVSGSQYRSDSVSSRDPSTSEDSTLDSLLGSSGEDYIKRFMSAAVAFHHHAEYVVQAIDPPVSLEGFVEGTDAARHLGQMEEAGFNVAEDEPARKAFFVLSYSEQLSYLIKHQDEFLSMLRKQRAELVRQRALVREQQQHKRTFSGSEPFSGRLSSGGRASVDGPGRKLGARVEKELFRQRLAQDDEEDEEDEDDVAVESSERRP